MRDIVITLTAREHATVLAALRCFQQQLNLNGGLPPRDVDCYFESYECLTDRRIDTLVTHINCEGERIKRKAEPRR